MNDSGDGGSLLPEGPSLPFELTARQRHQFRIVLQRLDADEHAPTTIRLRAAAAQLHLADSLAALELELFTAARQIADLGSGAGFPGIALAVALPAVEVSLIESQRRKCEFLTSLRAEAGVENATVVCARVEDWREGTARQDVVVARALAPQAVVLEYAAPLLRIGGALVDWRGRRAPELEAAADRAAEVLGLRRSEVLRTAPFEGATDHHLHVFIKHAVTPERFPRRAGMARKRPLAS
jgi:16S rRNA (guanine527-N7)-methyltransferase